MKYKTKVKSYITFEYKQSIEVEAESEDEAHDNAMEIMDNFQKELYSPIKTDFNGEKAIFFFRSNSSWHSFEYDDPDIGERLSININFFFPKSKSS